MMQKILNLVSERTARDERVAWVTVTRTRGSSPASAGQVMAVAADGETAGTIGGGASEHAVVQQALEAIAGGGRLFTFEMDHAQEGMVCGGGMEGFGNILGQEARLVIFGGGHVAQQLAPLAHATGFSVVIVEDRPELAAAFENVTYVVATPDTYARDVRILPETYVAVCTRGHQTDDAALRYCLTQSPRYLGMIGSRRKVDALMGRLRAEGVDEALLAQVFAPIGLAIATGRPAEIAVSILAEMLLVKNDGAPCHMRDRN